MADNTTLNLMAGGDTMATDDIGGTKFPRGKITLGADGVNDGDVASGNPMPVKEKRPTSGGAANVSASASSTTLLASNANRLGATIYNDSTVALYVKLGATASTTSFHVKMAAADYYELPQPAYTGVIDGIWDSATGSARVGELT